MQIQRLDFFSIKKHANDFTLSEIILIFAQKESEMKRLLRYMALVLLVAVFVSCNSNGNKEKLRRWAMELNAHSPEDLLGVKYTDENELLFLYVLNTEDKGIFNDFVNRQSQMKRKQMLLLSTNSKNINDYFQALIAQEGKIVYERRRKPAYKNCADSRRIEANFR